MKPLKILSVIFVCRAFKTHPDVPEVPLHTLFLLRRRSLVTRKFSTNDTIVMLNHTDVS